MDYTSYVYIAIALLPFVARGSIIIALSKKAKLNSKAYPERTDPQSTSQRLKYPSFLTD